MGHITAWEEDYKGNNTSPSLQSPLANSWSPSCMSSQLNVERTIVMPLFQTARRAVRETGPSCSVFRRLSFVFQGSGRSYVLSDGTSLDSSGAEVSLVSPLRPRFVNDWLQLLGYFILWWYNAVWCILPVVVLQRRIDEKSVRFHLENLVVDGRIQLFFP